LLATMMLGLAFWALGPAGLSAQGTVLMLLALAAFIPATDAATAIVNRVVAWSCGATPLPGLALRQGVPEHLRTLVAVPMLLGSVDDLLQQVEQLEVHHLSGLGGDL